MDGIGKAESHALKMWGLYKHRELVGEAKVRINRLLVATNNQIIKQSGVIYTGITLTRVKNY
jgi:hypothetical protein